MNGHLLESFDIEITMKYFQPFMFQYNKVFTLTEKTTTEEVYLHCYSNMYVLLFIIYFRILYKKVKIQTKN
jgi:hypothetical protein